MWLRARTVSSIVLIPAVLLVLPPVAQPGGTVNQSATSQSATIGELRADVDKETTVVRWRAASSSGRPRFFDVFSAFSGETLPVEPDQLPFGRSIAFLVGVSTYDNWIPLPGTARSVEELRKHLLADGGFDEVYELTGPATSPSIVRDFMRNVFVEGDRQLRRADRLLFYFAGHGMDRNANTGYLLFPHAAKNRLDEQSLATSEIREWSDLLPARHVLFLLDACSAGVGFEARPQSGTASGVLTSLGEGRSREIVSAGTGRQETFEIEDENGRPITVFGQALLRGLRASRAQDPFASLITVDQLFADLTAHVVDYANRKQVPLKPGRYSLQSDGQFLFVNPKETRAANELLAALRSKAATNDARIAAARREEAAVTSIENLSHTDPSPANPALAGLTKALGSGPEAAGLITNVIDTLKKRNLALDTLPPAQAFYVTHAFYTATADVRWKNELFARLVGFARQALALPPAQATGALDTRAVDFKPYLSTSWSNEDRLEFLSRILEIVEQTGAKGRALTVLDSLLGDEIAPLVRSDARLVARIAALHRHDYYRSALVRVAPEGFLAFVADELSKADATEDDLPGYDRRLQSAVDYPPAYEQSIFARIMELIIEAADACPDLQFPIATADVGVEGYESEEVVLISEVKAWRASHLTLIKKWVP